MKTKTKRSELMKQMRERKASGKRSKIKPVPLRLLRELAESVMTKPPTIKVLVTLPVKLARQLRERADSMDIPQSELVRRFLVRRKP